MSYSLALKDLKLAHDIMMTVVICGHPDTKLGADGAASVANVCVNVTQHAESARRGKTLVSFLVSSGHLQQWPANVLHKRSKLCFSDVLDCTTWCYVHVL